MNDEILGIKIIAQNLTHDNLFEEFTLLQKIRQIYTFKN